MLAIISLATDLTKMDYFSWTLLEAKRELFYAIVVVGYQDDVLLYSIFYTSIMMYWRVSLTYFDK